MKRSIVYVPSAFQGYREQFDESFVFTIPPVEGLPGKQPIPYDKMRHPLIYISLGSIIDMAVDRVEKLMIEHA